MPSNSELFFNDYKVKHGGHNGEFVCSPSYDPTGMLYDFELGMTVQKFRKYPGDVRLAKYKNLGGGKREGMFLFGNLTASRMQRSYGISGAFNLRLIPF